LQTLKAKKHGFYFSQALKAKKQGFNFFANFRKLENQGLCFLQASKT